MEGKQMVKLRGNKRKSKNWRLLKVAKNETNGITLIALAITIIVLLILARSNNCNFNRR